MKKEVEKYYLPCEPGPITIFMPIAAEPLTIHVQRNLPVLYALVDPKAEREYREFVTAETGAPIEAARLNHIGTVRLARFFGGPMVMHVFEVLQ